MILPMWKTNKQIRYLLYEKVNKTKEIWIEINEAIFQRETQTMLWYFLGSSISNKDQWGGFPGVSYLSPFYVVVGVVVVVVSLSIWYFYSLKYIML